MIAWLNRKLKGARTILLAWLAVAATYGLIFVDTLIGSLMGLSMEALKGAAGVALLVTIKQIRTDLMPRLKGQAKALSEAHPVNPPKDHA